MISFEDYKHYYLHYVNRVLGVREQEFDCTESSEEEKELFFNYATGTKILLMVAFIESNFLTSSQMKRLRKFEVIDEIPNNIHQSLLSSFIYIRDCVAHNPRIVLLSSGHNTDEFLRIINEGKFKYAKIQDTNIIVNEGAIHYLHLTVRKFFELQNT